MSAHRSPIQRARAAVLSTAVVRELLERPGTLAGIARVRDLRNRIRYGSGAPRFAERLWIDPLQVRSFDRKRTIWSSAIVVEGPWPTAHEQPIESDPIYRGAHARWHLGLSWEETGEVERMEKLIARVGPTHGCADRAGILRRCEQLDAIFHTIERERRVRPHGEVNPGTFREFGGIGMHLGPQGALIRAGNGRHRFAMALILKIPRIPVRIGRVHRSALERLEAYRCDGGPLVSAESAPHPSPYPPS